MTALDLPAYLRRIGHAGRCRPDLPTLEGLLAGQHRAIPFENLDVLAGRVPALDLPSVQRKLLGGGRGGYCYEQNTLLLAVLRELGFDARPLEARVRFGVPDGVVTGRTHLALRVVLDGQAWLADAGFGGAGAMVPVRFDGTTARSPDGATHRLVPLGQGLALQMQKDGGWSDCCHLATAPAQSVDLEMGNWHVATFPRAMLVNNLLVSRYVDGGRLTLFNRTLTFRQASAGAPDERELATDAEVGATLRERFGLAIGPDDLARAIARLPT